MIQFFYRIYNNFSIVVRLQFYIHTNSRLWSRNFLLTCHCKLVWMISAITTSYTRYFGAKIGRQKILNNETAELQFFISIDFICIWQLYSCFLQKTTSYFIRLALIKWEWFKCGTHFANFLPKHLFWHYIEYRCQHIDHFVG